MQLPLTVSDFSAQVALVSEEEHLALKCMEGYACQAFVTVSQGKPMDLMDPARARVSKG